MSFWCITAYFNPCGYRSLTNNYHIFKESLQKQKVNLLTLELSFDTIFRLKSQDIVRLLGNSIMWQKERLINYGISLLPDNCTAYAWLDCDIIFDDPEWSVKALKALESYDIIQLFKRVFYLPYGDKHYQRKQNIMFPGIVNQYNQHSSSWLYRREKKEISFAAPGLAWATRRNTFKDIDIYDRDITGSGDCILADTLLDSWSLHGYKVKFNDKMKRDILDWCGKIKKKKLTVSHLPVDIFHLWHGHFMNRGYMNRHKIILTHDFDPKVDIILKNNVYEWSTDKKQMHQEISQYFHD